MPKRLPPTMARLLERVSASLRYGKRSDPRGIVESCFGPLEVRVLDAMWERGRAASVRELQEGFPDTAYTTLMTTLDRLYKKGALDRERIGRAFVYRSICDRAEFESSLARDAFDLLFAGRMRGLRARPVLSGLVDAVSDDDALLLDELERIVQQKQAEKRKRGRSRRGDDR